MGALAYTGNSCNVCHGNVNEDGVSDGNRAIDPQNLIYTTREELASYIETYMPKNIAAPSTCVGECAEDIAAYILSWGGGTGPDGDGVIFSDDFEADDNGTQPQQWDALLTHSFGNWDNSPSSSVFALIDSSKAHGGSNSVQIKVDQSTASPSFLVRELPEGTSKVFVRVWVNMDVQLGGGTGDSPGSHSHIVGAMSDFSNNPANEARFGLVDGSRLGGMLFVGDAFTNEAAQDANIPVLANTWTCVEWNLESKAGMDQMRGWVNDEPVFTATAAADWQNNAGEDYAADTLNYIHLGWRPYGSIAQPESIWFDDLVISSERVGCN